MRQPELPSLGKYNLQSRHHPPNRKSVFPTWLVLLKAAKVLTGLIFMVSLAGYWENWGWAADVLSHFRLQYAILLAFAMLILLLRPNGAWLLLAFLGLGMNVAELAPAYLPAQRVVGWEDAPVEGHFTLLQMNVKRDNVHFDKAIALISALRPDIVTLNEVNRNWLDQLQPVFLKYPYSVARDRDDPYGIAIYSRFPLLKTKIYSFLKHRPHSQASIPSALAAFRLKGALVTILATHVPPPLTPGYYVARNEAFDAIARQRDALGLNLVLAGDLNLTPYSETLKDFLASTGLRDSRPGFGLQSTWPSFFPALGLPLDQVLLSESLVALKHRVGPDIGSMHRPVFVEIGILHPPDLKSVSPSVELDSPSIQEPLPSSLSTFPQRE